MVPHHFCLSSFTILFRSSFSRLFSTSWVLWSSTSGNASNFLLEDCDSNPIQPSICATCLWKRAQQLRPWPWRHDALRSHQRDHHNQGSLITFGGSNLLILNVPVLISSASIYISQAIPGSRTAVRDQHNVNQLRNPRLLLLHIRTPRVLPHLLCWWTLPPLPCSQSLSARITSLFGNKIREAVKNCLADFVR